MTKKALKANIGNKAIKEHQAAIKKYKSSGPKSSCPRVLEFVEVIAVGKNKLANK